MEGSQIAMLRSIYVTFIECFCGEDSWKAFEWRLPPLKQYDGSRQQTVDQVLGELYTQRSLGRDPTVWDLHLPPCFCIERINQENFFTRGFCWMSRDCLATD